MKRTLSLLGALLTMLVLTACGGGGGGGPQKADITSATQKDLAVAATGATKDASSAQNTPIFKISGTSSSKTMITELVKRTLQNSQAPQDYSYLCTGGGSYVLDIPTSSSSSGTITGTFTSCDVGGVIIDGTISISYTSNSFTYTANITYNDGMTSETLNYGATCTFDSGTYTVGSCTYNADGTGLDGRTYSVSNLSVSGSDMSGWTVSGTVNDPDHGEINFTTTTPVVFNCSNGAPSSGVITITNGTDTATITYNDCNSFTVTLNGTPTVYNWVDIIP